MDFKNTKKTEMKKKFKSKSHLKKLINLNVENLKKRNDPKKYGKFFLKKNIKKSKSSVNFQKKGKLNFFVEKINKKKDFFKKKQSISTHNLKNISLKKIEIMVRRNKLSLNDIKKIHKKKIRNKYSFKKEKEKKNSLKSININHKKINYKNRNLTSKYKRIKKNELLKNSLNSENLNKTSLDKNLSLFFSKENYSKNEKKIKEQNDSKKKIDNITSLRSINTELEKSSEENLNFIKKNIKTKKFSNSTKILNSNLKNSSKKLSKENLNNLTNYISVNSDLKTSFNENLSRKNLKKSYDENFLKRINLNKKEILKNHYKIQKTDKELISDTLRHFRSISNQKSIKEIININKKIHIKRNFKSMDSEKKKYESFDFDKNKDLKSFEKLKILTEFEKDENYVNYQEKYLNKNRKSENFNDFRKKCSKNKRNSNLILNIESEKKLKFKIIKKDNIFIKEKLKKKKDIKKSLIILKKTVKKLERKKDKNKNLFFQSNVVNNKSLFKSIISKNDSLKKKKKFKLGKKKSILTNITDKICKCENLNILYDFLKIEKTEKKNIIDLTIKKINYLEKKIENSEKEKRKLKDIIKKNFKNENFGEYLQSIKKDKRKKILKDSFKKPRIKIKKLLFKINSKTLYSSKNKKKNISSKFMNLFDKNKFSNLQNMRKSNKKRALKSFR